MDKHSKINNGLAMFFGVRIYDDHPERQSIIDAKQLFKDKEIVACEIGVARGQHVEEMFKHLNIKKVYAIDSYIEYPEYVNDVACQEAPAVKIAAHKRLKKYGDKVVWIEKFSDDAINDIEVLDFLYIDGNHWHPFIDNDINNYLPKVKKGGIISGHDYYVQDVKDAVFTLSKRLNKPFNHGKWDDWVFIV